MGHILYILVALPCTIGAIALAIQHIYRHLLNYTEPTYQRYIVRIIFMVPGTGVGQTELKEGVAVKSRDMGSPISTPTKRRHKKKLDATSGQTSSSSETNSNHRGSFWHDLQVHFGCSSGFSDHWHNSWKKITERNRESRGREAEARTVRGGGRRLREAERNRWWNWDMRFGNGIRD